MADPERIDLKNIELFGKQLCTLKQDFFDAIHPIGEVYTQYPQQDDPMTLYNKNGITSVWEEQLQYNGAFFRSSNALNVVWKIDGESNYYTIDNTNKVTPVKVKADTGGAINIASSSSGHTKIIGGKTYKDYAVTGYSTAAAAYINKTNNLNIQGQTIQSHNHTIAHTHTQQGTFNTDEKGGHTHTTNSQSSSSFRTSTKIYNSSNTEITNTQEMSGSTYAHIRCFDLHDGSVQGRASILSGWTGGTSEGIDGASPYQNDYLNINLSHSHNMQHNHTVDISHTHGTDSQGAHTHSVTISGSTKGSSNADSGSTGSTETRPDNYSYVIWKRIA